MSNNYKYGHVYNCFIFSAIIVFIVLIDIFKLYWKMIFCLFPVAKAGVPSVILSS